MALRYAILRHEGIATPHFDLMFETAPGSPLATWRADAWPPTAGAVAEKLADHRGEYLSFEGLLDRGRGWVARVESGTCEIVRRSGKVWHIDLRDPRPARPPLALRLEARADGLWNITLGA